MQDVELWLRLMNVRRLNAAKTVQLVERLRQLTEVTAEVLSALALSEEQVTQFFTLDEREYETALRWLEEPTHHLLTYADARYPPYCGRSLLRLVHCLCVVTPSFSVLLNLLWSAAVTLLPMVRSGDTILRRNWC